MGAVLRGRKFLWRTGVGQAPSPWAASGTLNLGENDWSSPGKSSGLNVSPQSNFCTKEVTCLSSFWSTNSSRSSSGITMKWTESCSQAKSNGRHVNHKSRNRLTSLYFCPLYLKQRENKLTSGSSSTATISLTVRIVDGEEQAPGESMKVAVFPASEIFSNSRGTTSNTNNCRASGNP
ncbi:hypothetical protein YC2023_058259 [Brassica napus]